MMIDALCSFFVHMIIIVLYFICFSNDSNKNGITSQKADCMPATVPNAFIFIIIIHFPKDNYSVQCSRSIMSDSLWPRGLQHTSLPCPSPAPGTCSISCSSSWWCHPTISSSVIPFSSCLQSFPASGAFPMSQFFTSGGQSIEISASASVFPMNIQGWFSLGLTGLISLQSKRLSRVFSNTTVQEHLFFGAQLSLWSNSHIHMWLLERP